MVFVGGGVAAAQVAGGVINACVNNSSGTIHIGTACSSNEIPLQWNAQGVPGPQGTAAATGPQGPACTALAKTVWAPAVSLDQPGDPNPSTPVATLTLPAGSYAIIGRVEAGVPRSALAITR